MITFGAITTLLYHSYENVVKGYVLLTGAVLQSYGYEPLTGSRCFHDILLWQPVFHHGCPSAVYARCSCRAVDCSS